MRLRKVTPNVFRYFGHNGKEHWQNGPFFGRVLFLLHHAVSHIFMTLPLSLFSHYRLDQSQDIQIRSNINSNKSLGDKTGWAEV